MRCTAITLAVLVSSLLWGCSAANEPQARLKVFKPDLAAQCESSGISLAEMQGELSGSNITVHCAQKGHNGMMQWQFAAHQPAALISTPSMKTSCHRRKPWALHLYPACLSIKTSLASNAAIATVF